MNSSSSKKKAEINAADMAQYFISHNKQTKQQTNDPQIKTNIDTSTKSDSISLEDTKSSISEDSNLINQNSIISKIEEIELNDHSNSQDNYLEKSDVKNSLIMNHHCKKSTIELEETIALSKTINRNIIIDYDFYIQSNLIYNRIMYELLNNQLNTINMKTVVQLLAYDWFEQIKEKNNYIKQQKDQDSYFIIQLNLFGSLLFIDQFKKQLDKNEIDYYCTLVKSSKIYLLYLLGKKILHNSYMIDDTNKDSLLQCQKLLTDNKITMTNSDIITAKLASFIKAVEEIGNRVFSFINKKNKSFKEFYESIHLYPKKSFEELLQFIHLNIYFQNKIKEIETKKYNYLSQEFFNESCELHLPLKKNNHKKYTLVLDLDETLVHYVENDKNNSSYIQIREGSDEFITALSKYYEIVIFTASMQEYADIVIDSLESNQLIDYRLYRQHTIQLNGINIKDISKLDRDLTKVIIIDNHKISYQLQPDNGVEISEYNGQETDKELYYLLEDLLALAHTSVNDVRKYLPYIRMKMEMRYNKKH